jgi:hypothetical protein
VTNVGAVLPEGMRTRTVAETGNRVVVLSEEHWNTIDLLLFLIAEGGDTRTANREVVQEVLMSFREHTVISKSTEDLLKSASELRETLDRLQEQEDAHPYRGTEEWAAVYGAYVAYLCQKWDAAQLTSFASPDPVQCSKWAQAAERFADEIERLRHESR